jgi:hypothetical protein
MSLLSLLSLLKKRIDFRRSILVVGVVMKIETIKMKIETFPDRVESGFTFRSDRSDTSDIPIPEAKRPTAAAALACFDEGEGAAGALADADGLGGAHPPEGFHDLG